MSLSGTGDIYAWGSNSSGQLALGDTIDRHFPTLQPGATATGIACAGFHSLCINGGGDVYGAGSNSYADLGLGDTAPRLSWTFNNNVSATIGVAGGADHSLFLDIYGDVFGSGLNANGQLGIGSTNNVTTSAVVGGYGLGVIGMAGGAGHTLLLTSPRIRLASVTISPTSVKGGTSATGTVTLNGLAGPGGQRVYLYVL